VTITLFLPELGSTLAGVLQLQRAAFTQAASASQEAMLLGLAIVLLAGFSEAVAASIVLFANRVRPARLFFSWTIGAVLFFFGYAFLVISTWLVCRLPGTPHLSLQELAIVLALGYAPMLFAFLGALPYLGPGIFTVLRIWNLLAMVAGVEAIGRVDIPTAAICVALGWTVMLLAQRSFGKPIALLGTRIFDAVAGVQLIDDERLIVGRAVAGMRKTAHPQVDDGDVTPVSHNATSTRPAHWKAVLGLLGVAFLALIVWRALEPMHAVLFGWAVNVPGILRLPLDLIWLAVLGFIVAAIMAPLETLGWWAGWYGDRIETSVDEVPRDETAPCERVARYAIYLDGIAQSNASYCEEIETFLDALAPELPAGVCLIRGVMAYSVLNRPLDDDPLWSLLWKFVDKERYRAIGFPAVLLRMIVDLRNVMIVAVSADPRYGPMYNFGVAYVMYRSLLANGYRLRSGTPVTLIGYSGGAQMACGAAHFLKAALGAPIRVISLGGVISGDDPILALEHVYHLVGTKDRVERIGLVMFPSRWAIAVHSYWNRAKRIGRLTQIPLGPVGHFGRGSMLDPQTRLADGRTNLRETLDSIEAVVGPAPLSAPAQRRLGSGVGEAGM
jgi:hypothetical protein